MNQNPFTTCCFLLSAFFVFVTVGCGAPAELPAANWSGTWSSHYPLINGMVYAQMPDPLPNGEFEAEVLIEYSWFCVYRPGMKLHLKMNGSLTPSVTSGKNNTPLAVKDAEMPYILKIMSKSSGASQGQQIEFEAVPNESRSRFDGKYTSHDPWDTGKFTIHKMRP